MFPTCGEGWGALQDPVSQVMRGHGFDLGDAITTLGIVIKFGDAITTLGIVIKFGD